MTEIQKEYTKLLNIVSSPKWKTNRTFRVGHAGAAIVISFLENGELKIGELTKRIPDFSQSEIRMALKRLMENGYFEKKTRKDKVGYVLNVDDGEGLTSGVWWGLLINVVEGFIKRSDKK